MLARLGSGRTAHDFLLSKCMVRSQGAAEIVLRRCVSVMDPSGEVVPLEDAMRSVLEETVTTMASTGLRTLCLTKRDINESMADGQPDFFENPPDDNLTLCCIVGIKARPPPLITQRPALLLLESGLPSVFHRYF